MKNIAAASLIVVLAAPAFADAEDFGAAMLARSNSAPTSQEGLLQAAKKLSNGRVDEKVFVADETLATRDEASQTYTAGHLRLAAEMNVDPADFSAQELSAMYIGAYN